MIGSDMHRGKVVELKVIAFTANEGVSTKDLGSWGGVLHELAVAHQFLRMPMNALSHKAGDTLALANFLLEGHTARRYTVPPQREQLARWSE